MTPEGMPMEGGPMPQSEMPPTGGMPQPTGIPPQVLSAIANQTGGLPNTQM
jgi:hypothetical protein